jgi:hypothetical protein
MPPKSPNKSHQIKTYQNNSKHITTSVMALKTIPEQEIESITRNHIVMAIKLHVIRDAVPSSLAPLLPQSKSHVHKNKHNWNRVVTKWFK